MTKTMSEEKEIEQSIGDQIFTKTIEKLKESDLFPKKLIDKMKEVDLSNKMSVKTVLSFKEEEEE